MMPTFLVVFLIVLPSIKCTKDAALEIIRVDGKYNELQNYSIDNTKEYVIVFPTSSSDKPFRVSAWTKTGYTSNPILVVVRQEREVLSWELPFVVEASSKVQKLKFMNTSRTLCHNNMNDIIRAVPKFRSSRLLTSQLNQSLIIAVSTSSRRKVDLHLRVSEELKFYIVGDETYSIQVSPSQTRYFYYMFPTNKTDTVVVKVNSEDDVCLTVSIQDSKCPVFDLDKDITHAGKYQTVDRQGAITIWRKDFPNGFFLVFVAKADNAACSDKNSVIPVASRNAIVKAVNRTSTVNFTVDKSINSGQYYGASLITIAILTVFCVFCIVVAGAFSHWGTVSKIKKNGVDQVDAELFDDTNPVSRMDIEQYLEKGELNLRCLAKYPLKDKRRSFNYLWHIWNIAIFYAIPVVQLVITYQRVLNQTGNQDLCYYNFLCAHPALGMSDFNHIFSNIGYVITGILFLLITLHRHTTIPMTFERGIPVHYGLYYSMGVALIIEGVLSACYHICPTQSNYQFDTSFMYVMAVLCMVKLYQNRHPDVNATAYATFTVLGIAIFLAMVGILDGSLAIWIMFAVAYSVLCIYVSFKIYFFSFVLDGVKKLKENILEHGLRTENFSPVKRARFFLLLFANIVNYAMLITGVCFYDTGVTDFGTFLLALLMGNAVLHTMFYTGMKLVHHERICFEAIIYGVCMIVTWVGATIFFVDYATIWTVSPAQSRKCNQDCIFLDFYDKHDVWHLLSSAALYFSFMYLISLDDDLMDKNQEEIPVF